MHEPTEFAYSILDSLSAHVAIVGSDGSILAVNRAWRVFCDNNTPKGLKVAAQEGTNYLSVCENSKGLNSEEAGEMLVGIRAVINREKEDFSILYPCHSPTEKRWFQAHVTPFIEEDTTQFIV
ncbi:MAG: hypothetical protein IPG24_26705, partial [Leptospiraceae bacterium]|nr:hypothetical protein [Leptospiraceae bacterium]